VARHIALLRGVNLGPNKRVEMPRLRELLTGLGYGEVRTYVQSGNVVLTSRKSPGRLEGDLGKQLSAAFGADIEVLVRTRDELADVIDRNPLAEVAVEPKRHQVTFLSAEVGDEVTRKLAGAKAAAEQVVVSGREIYAWHPDGVGRSKLATLLAGRGLGVTATSRNWNTVTQLLALADA
jgi:uncharacterized protein (DUF1697 family)